MHPFHQTHWRTLPILQTISRLRQTGEKAELLLHVKGLTPDERDILLDGCLMNYYAKRG